MINKSVNKYLTYIAACLISLLAISWSFADTASVSSSGSTSTSSTTSGTAATSTSTAECTLTEIPEKLQVFKENMQTLSDAAIKVASQGQWCREPEVGDPDWAKAIAIITWGASVQRASAKAKTVWESILHTLTGIDFYFRRDNTAVPDYLLEHQKYLLEIDEIINKTVTEAGRRCGTRYEFTEDVSLSDSLYKTKGATVQNVITDMTSNHREITRFIRNLALQREPSQMDESIIPIAPSWFDEAMRSVYTQENINACEEAQPETQAMKEKISELFTSGWKYDDAIKVWKEAFQMLVYRWESSTSSSGSFGEKVKDEVGKVIAKIAWGISRSWKLQSDEEKKAVWQSTNDRSFQEHAGTFRNRIANIWQQFRRDRYTFTIRDVYSFLLGKNTSDQTQSSSIFWSGADEGTGESGTTLTPTELTDIDADLLSVVTLQVELNQTYEEVIGSTVAPEWSQASYDVAPLVDSINLLQKFILQSERNMEIACEALQKEGYNIEPNSCEDVLNSIFEAAKKG